MKKIYYRLWQRGKSEEGQSMLEFVLVLPVFMLLLAMTFDFGWFFYNQISVENSARNAARVACVSYNHVAYDSPNNVTGNFKEYDLKTYKDILDNTADREELDNCTLSEQEIQILKQVNASVPKGITDVKVYVAYSYDKQYLAEKTDGSAPYDVKDRSKGDVTVVVSGTHHAITPIVAWGSGEGMTRQINCKSVYKVEPMM